jgi:hypothetical protein
VKDPAKRQQFKQIFRGFETTSDQLNTLLGVRGGNKEG